jgi:hypothetical protein
MTAGLPRHRVRPASPATAAAAGALLLAPVGAVLAGRAQAGSRRMRSMAASSSSA